MNKVTRTILPIILVFVLLLTGCNTLSGSSGKTSPEAPVEGTRVGNLAPDFQLRNLEGQAISLNSLKGSPVMINFWASWCGPCRAEMPYLQQIYEEWSGKELKLLTINIGESSSVASSFMQSYNLSLPVMLDTRQTVSREYNILGIPSTFFIDKDGIIQGVKVGAFQSKEEIETGIRLVSSG